MRKCSQSTMNRFDGGWWWRQPSRRSFYIWHLEGRTVTITSKLFIQFDLKLWPLITILYQYALESVILYMKIWSSGLRFGMMIMCWVFHWFHFVFFYCHFCLMNNKHWMNVWKIPIGSLILQANTVTDSIVK